jgi:hypothetical protein
MNSYRLPARRPARAPIDPLGYATRRLASLLVVAAAFGGIVVASLLDGAGVPEPFALAIGLVLFVGAATLATSVAARDNTAASSDAPDGWLRGWGQSSQLGPDPEAVIGRKTGARI